MKNLFNNEEWLSRLAYLADIFNKINTLNMSINMTIFIIYDKLNSFKRKLDLYPLQLKEKYIFAIPNLSSCIDKNELSLKEDLNADILEHLETKKFQKTWKDKGSFIDMQALQCLTPFVTTYLCESGFSEFLYLKNKYKSRLDIQSDLRVNISSIQPDIDVLVQNKPQQISH
ncbi:zinc finger BED domain-containing protein 5-like [Rhopalosiphum maidis]|uniref:zinc finger BED domain-containing protein 5-like n=1 Tax=Rhopalosiphum maidis TaxID=43146 RepID=UPI000EFF8929|nr:zinc finger BED domain-containing protein 5-like [Rhopalosiphum maidis]